MEDPGLYARTCIPDTTENQEISLEININIFKRIHEIILIQMYFNLIF